MKKALAQLINTEVPLVSTAWTIALLIAGGEVQASQSQVVHGHVPRVTAHSKLIGRLPGSNRLDLVVGLPLRNRPGLTNLLEQLYDPSSTNFHQYLTPVQFAQRFGPSEEDYREVREFAERNGLKVTRTYPNRALLDVNGSVADIEKALNLTLQVYQHPKEARTFYAPSADPSLDLKVPVLHIARLDNLHIPRPNRRLKALENPSQTTPRWGSGTNGLYMGADFRAAYSPGVSLTGAGQVVGLLQFASYHDSDIKAYEAQAGLPNVPVHAIVLGPWTPDYDVEVNLDIDMVISMAPGLSKVLVYEGFISHDMLQAMADDNAAKQLSCSWSWDFYDPTMNQIFQQFAAQGQSFFASSGDDCAYTGDIDTPSDNPFITIVGGTTLATSGPGGAWTGETVWNWGNGTGSGGGISTDYSIPAWQQGINMSPSQGSTTRRNIPDVAMCADDVLVIDNGKVVSLGGTSVAAPLWAGFMALVNEQAAANGQSPMGFVNPALYDLAQRPSYSSIFHDITSGNNTSSRSPNKFYAVQGYDLCTGWGSPVGGKLIEALLGYAGPTWVQFGRSDSGNGSYWNPYNTLLRGVTGVRGGGTVLIKSPGSSAETMTITKPMSIRAVGGTAVIGG